MFFEFSALEIEPLYIKIKKLIISFLLGLKSHPQHDIFKLQASGHSGIISFYLKGGPEKSERLLKALKVFTVTEVSGCGESTAQIP